MSLALLNTKTAANRGVKIDIVHPATNEPLGIRITVLGTDSEAFRLLQREQQKKRTEKMRKSRNPMSAMMSPEEIDAEALDVVVACTVGWETVLVDDLGRESGTRPEIELTDGEWLPCTPENARRIYADAGFTWLKKQVDQEIGDYSHFLQK